MPSQTRRTDVDHTPGGSPDPYARDAAAPSREWSPARTTRRTTHAGDFHAAAAAHAGDRNAREYAAARADVTAAVKRDAAADERPVSAQDLLERSRDAAAWAVPGLSADALDDLASEVRIAAVRRHGTWTPRSCDVTRKYLALRAVSLWRDARKRVADTLDAASMDAATTDDDGDVSTRHDFHAAALGTHLAAHAADAGEVCAALGITEGTPAGDAITAGLSGWKTTHDVAAAYGITEGSAEVRLSRGRAEVRRRMGTAVLMVARLLAADAGELPLAVAPCAADSRPMWRCPITGERTTRPASPLARLDGIRNPAQVTDDRLRLSAPLRALRGALDGLGMTTACVPHAAALAPVERTTDGAQVPAVGGMVAAGRLLAAVNARASRRPSTHGRRVTPLASSTRPAEHWTPRTAAGRGEAPWTPLAPFKATPRTEAPTWTAPRIRR